ncbi:BA14K family protein [Brevundimonas sp.]|uniref:BA14K family protein n=1 Tax=Brevundimonas sp. TaxID=1871086 RepID=UPI001A20695E|nr:BA14K family protein [Brevundimonas sp.]MBJ7486589.1 BA14K family protein [Brevundimonas sp.]
MRTLLIAAAAGLMTLSALPVAAAVAPQERPYTQDTMRGQDRGRNDNDWNNGRGNDRNEGRNDNDRYGRWDNGWGARPAGPPRGWTRTNDWYRHVRACSQRYRSYNPRTDTYVVRRNVVARCRL